MKDKQQIRLGEAWTLATNKERGEGLRSIMILSKPRELWAVYTDDERPGLLIEAKSQESVAAAIAFVKKSSGALGAEIFAHTGAHQRRYVLLTRLRPDVAEAFAALCESIILQCEREASAEEAIVAAVAEFKRLVTATGEEGSERITGLLGELVVLMRIVQEDVAGIRSWSFPILERQDFRNGQVALEVKTTLRSSNSGQVVSISALDQLEPLPDGRLFVVHVALERDPAGAVALPLLVADIASHLPEAERAGFADRVFGNTPRKLQPESRFAVKDIRCYAVTDAFPRLTPSRLATGEADPGVGRVHYELDLAFAASSLYGMDKAVKALIRGKS